MGKKILIVEDDPSFLRAISYILQKEGFEVTTATNGLQGLTRAQQDNPDLLALDVMLPGLDGYEVCHRLRAEPQTAEMPIIMLSAKGQEVDRATGLKVGADVYLTKPVDRSVLIEQIEALLEQKS